MTDQASERENPLSKQEKAAQTLFEQEAVYGVKKRERMAWLFALGGMGVGLCSIVAVVILLPLKEVQAHVVIVDKDTGLAERAVNVRQASVTQSEAVKQSLLYGYVKDRETFDVNDNEYRITKVYRQSLANAKSSLATLWNPDSKSHPDRVYGTGAVVTIKILSISAISEDVAQVRYIKTLATEDGAIREGKFTATVTYRLNPSKKSNINLVWENPFGFQVLNYRTTSETLEGQNNE